ncbi:MAG: SGNH/GDSL hydrolase family protein [Acetobacteraceae bacterium]|nr:SGNH/GDSL hydrolase family protein [Acetobacteraceae bacterium]
MVGRWFLAAVLAAVPLLPLRAQSSAQPGAQSSAVSGPRPGAAQNAVLSTEPEHCDTPDELIASPSSFADVAAALQPGRTLAVLAVGSATIVNPDRSTDASFPAVMAAALRAAVPGVEVTVTVRSGRGMTAADMVPVLKDALARHRYQLIVWQTGTVEAVRGLPPDDFLQTLTEGIQAARDAGADVVLVDPQFSRFLRANANLDPYLQIMRQAGTMADADLFPRFDLMKHWVDAGEVDMERVDRAHRDSAARTVHACLGRALARFVLQAAATAKP